MTQCRVPRAGCREADLTRHAAPGTSYEFQNVPELLLLGLEILLGPMRRRDLERDALDDLEAEAFDGDIFRRIVRHQPYLADAEVAKNLGAGAVVADVGGEAELRIGLDRVIALLLKLIGFQFVEQSDSPPLLQQVEDHALFLGRDELECALELRATIA